MQLPGHAGRAGWTLTGFCHSGTSCMELSNAMRFNSGLGLSPDRLRCMCRVVAASSAPPIDLQRKTSQSQHRVALSCLIDAPRQMHSFVSALFPRLGKLLREAWPTVSKPVGTLPKRPATTETCDVSSYQICAGRNGTETYLTKPLLLRHGLADRGGDSAFTH